MPQSEQSAWDRVIAPWWAKVTAGLLMILFSILNYRDLAALESGERDSLWIGRSTSFLYDIGGRPLAAGVPMAIGVAMIAWGVAQLVRRTRP